MAALWLMHFHAAAELSRCSELVYTIHAGMSQFNIALPHSFVPTTVFHQSRSPLRPFFKTAVGTK
jgi:hypothetical protein